VMTLRHRAAAPEMQAWKDGVSLGTNTAGSAGAVAQQNIGSFGDGGGNFAEADIAAVILYARALSDAEVNYVNAFLLEEYRRPFLPDEIQIDNPVHWFRLNDAAGTFVDRGSLLSNATGVNSPNRGVEGLIAHDPGRAVGFVGANGTRIDIPHNVAHTTPPYTIEAVVRRDGNPGGFGVNVVAIKENGAAATAGFSFGISTTPDPDKPFMTLFQNDGTKRASTASATVAIGQRFHMLATVGGVGQPVVLYINGAAQPASANQTLPAQTADGVLALGALPPAIEVGTVTVQDFAFYASALSSARILAHANAAISGT
jgi:hypothetical protein